MQIQARFQTPLLARKLPVKAEPKPFTEARPAASAGVWKQAGNYVGERLLDLSYTASALPKFIYPTVTGTAEQQALTWEALNHLPMHQAVRPVSIETLPTLPQGPNLLGVNRSVLGQIKINQGGYGMQFPWRFKETVTHEVGHSVDYKGGMLSFLTRQNESANHQVFGQGPFVSDYAETKPVEDFAESYKVHHTDAQRLQAVNPAKAEAMGKLDQPHFLERLVDREAYRETGKFIGRQFQGLPIARSGLELLRQSTILTMALNGTTETVQGIVKGRPGQAVSGLLDLSAGLGMAMAPQQPWLGVVASAALGAKKGAQLAYERGADASRQALAAGAGAVGGTLGGFLAPLGLVQAGYALAGPIGGTVGLLVGGLAGSHYGSRLAAGAALALAS